MLHLFTLLLLLLLHLFHAERDACCARQVDFDQLDLYKMQKKKIRETKRSGERERAQEK